MSKINNGRIHEYDVLRVITTLLVVIGHAKYYKIYTPYGGCDYSGFVEAELISWKLITAITSFIYSFHMPLFMALGGALFYGSYQKGRFPNITCLAKNKALRLLVPFVITGVCFSFPMKYVTGYFAQSDNLVKDYIIGQVLVQGNTHLWYLLAMFFVFMVVYCMERCCHISNSIKLLGLLVISICSRLITIKLIYYVLFYTFWFYLGFTFEKFRKQINEKVTLRRTVFLGLISFVLFILIRAIDGQDDLLSRLCTIGFDIVQIISSCLTTYMVAYLLSDTQLINLKWYKTLSNDTFGIYLYSDPINYLILYVAAITYPYTLYATNVGACFLYVFRIVVSLLISIGITELLRRLKVKYII